MPGSLILAPIRWRTQRLLRIGVCATYTADTHTHTAAAARTVPPHLLRRLAGAEVREERLAQNGVGHPLADYPVP